MRVTIPVPETDLRTLRTDIFYDRSRPKGRMTPPKTDNVVKNDIDQKMFHRRLIVLRAHTSQHILKVSLRVVYHRGI